MAGVVWDLGPVLPHGPSDRPRLGDVRARDPAAQGVRPRSRRPPAAPPVARARAVPGRSPDGVRLLSACPPRGSPPSPAIPRLALARGALFSLDSPASADPAPPGCLVASRVTRERPSSRSASGGRPGTPLGSAGERSRVATPAASGSPPCPASSRARPATWTRGLPASSSRDPSRHPRTLADSRAETSLREW